MGQMAAAGGAIGSAFAPGVGTAIGTVLGGLLDGPMAGGASQQGPTGPTSAATAVYGSGLNADAWSVNFSGKQSTYASIDKPFSATGPTATTAAQGGTVIPAAALGGGSLSGIANSLGLDLSGVPTWAFFAVGALLVWKISKSNK